MATQQRHWPTAMIVIAVLLLAGPAIWLLAIALDYIWAFGIVGILVVVVLVGAFIFVKRRYDADHVT